MIDYAFATVFQTFQPPWLTTVMRAVSGFGGVAGYVIVVPLVVGYYLWRGRHRLALATVLVLAGNVLDPLIKWVVGRPRPSLEQMHVLGSAPGSSFPSGHALAATIFYGFLIYVSATRRTPHRRMIIAALTLLIFLIGYSRVYLGVHWPTDVIAGFDLGLVWLIVFTHFWAGPKVVDTR